MNLYLLAAAAGEAAPESKFGFVEAMTEGGPVAWSILAIMIIMSVGSFYILFTKLFEQNKVLKQYKTVQTTFWRAPSLKEGATKLEKDGPWRQLADDAVKAQEDHGKMTDSSNRMTTCTARSSVRKIRSTPCWLAACRSSPPSVRPRPSSVCSAP